MRNSANKKPLPRERERGSTRRLLLPPFLPHLAVVFVAIDAPRLLVLLVVNGLAVLLGQVAIILCAHAALFVVDARLLVLQVRGFAGRELTALHALCDALLLVALALVDVVIVLSRCGCWGGSLRNHQ